MNCIVNISVGGWYPKGAQRLKKSLDRVGFSGSFISWTEYPPGVPSHQEKPYAFKCHAFKWALEQGYDNALWLDASAWANHSLQPVFDKIEQDGYFVLLNGWSSGHWCSDQQLAAFNLTREEAFNVPHPMGFMIGINFQSSEGMSLYRDYFDHQHLFPGPWNNNDKSVSQDPRVLGTRHDQSILGLVIHRHKLKYTEPQGWIEYPPCKTQELYDEAIVLAQGM